MPSFRTWLEMPIDVEYDLQPYEAQTLTYPGCEASVTVCSVSCAGIDLPIDDEISRERLEAEILEHLMSRGEDER